MIKNDLNSALLDLEAYQEPPITKEQKAQMALYELLMTELGPINHNAPFQDHKLDDYSQFTADFEPSVKMNETATSLSPDRKKSSESSETTAEEGTTISDVSGLYSELNSRSSCRNVCFRFRYKMITSKAFYAKFVPCAGLMFFLGPYLSLFLLVSGHEGQICMVPLIVEESIIILIIVTNVINLFREEYWFVTWNRESLGHQFQLFIFHICLLVFLCGIRFGHLRINSNPLIALLSLYSL